MHARRRIIACQNTPHQGCRVTQSRGLYMLWHLMQAPSTERHELSPYVSRCMAGTSMSYPRAQSPDKRRAWNGPTMICVEPGPVGR